MDNSIFIGRTVSKETRAWLLQNKIRFEEHPLIQIEYNMLNFSEFEQFRSQRKQFVVTSQWAAKWLVEYNAEMGLKDEDSIFCLSEKQKLILKDVSKNIFVSKKRNAKSLANLVISKNNQELVIFLHGNRTLNIIESQLSSFYSGFVTIEVYRNYPVYLRLKKKFSAYIFFSPGGVENFNDSGNSIPETAEIFAIGETTADACKLLFKNKVSISEQQDEISVIKYAVDRIKQVLTEN